jgi:hypothetical protein
MHAPAPRVVVALVAAACTGLVRDATGAAGAAGPVVVTVAGADGPADLYPGFAGGDISFTLHNRDGRTVTFTRMTPGAVTSSDPACPPASIEVSAADGLRLEVDADATSARLTIPDVVAMRRDAPDGCQGATFAIRLVLDGRISRPR